MPFNYDYTYKFNGSPTTIFRKNLNINASYGGAQGVSKTLIVSTEDNDSAASEDLNIVGDLNIAGGTSSYLRYMLKANASSIDVDGEVDIGRDGYGFGALDMGSATFRVGGNWDVRRDSGGNRGSEFIDSAWKAGTSTVIFDGNGASNPQTIYADGMPLNNMTVDTLGSVTLSSSGRDDLILHGHLKILNGTFDANSQQITFNGDGHTFEAAGGTTVDLDNVILVEDAVLTLLSDMTIDVPDNLIMMTGSRLYLNGFTLDVEGEDPFVSSEVSQAGIPWDEGTIYGTEGIPEPGTLLLLGTGALGIIGYLRRQRMR